MTDIVERRQRYIDRQRALRASAPEGRREASYPLGSGSPNRHGLPSLPVGQHEVRNWPVLDLGTTPRVATADWRLDMGGDVHAPVTLDWDAFGALEHVEDVSDFHCVTTWSRMNNHWRGVRFKTLAELVVPHDSVTTVLCTGYDTLPGSNLPYTTNVPLERALEDDVLLVVEWEGRPLPVEHGGPCRMITPKLYAWKGTKWIRRIDFLSKDRPGFWEQRGYSSLGDPWQDDRYSHS